MMQQGQVLLALDTARGQSRWAYRYRIGGRDARRVQRWWFRLRALVPARCSRACRRWGPLGGADDARQRLLEEPGEAIVLVGGEPAEVELSHGGVVDDLRA